MALLNKLLAGYSISNEMIYRTGSTSLPLEHDTILYPASNISISTGRSSTGTILTLTTDYTFSDEDTRLTTSAGSAVYTKLAIVNGTYQNMTLYVNYKTVGDYAKTEDLNRNFTFRNKLINGGLGIWQRGTSLAITTAGSAYYQADRWNNTVVGTSSATTYSRQTFTPGQVDVPGNPKYYMRHAITSGGDSTNGRNSILQSIEGIETFAGETCVVSFYAKANAAKNITVEIVQNYGTGGSTTTYITPVKFGITTTWAKYVVPIAVPSITGKTIGTDSDYLALLIWMSAGSANNTRSSTLGIQTGTFDFAQFQIEKGSVPTEFEQRPPQVELSLCQRYYQILASGAEAANAGVGSGQCFGVTSCLITTRLPVELRVKPSAVELSSVSHFNVLQASSGSQTCTSMGLDAATSKKVIELSVGVASGLSAGNATCLRCDNTASALMAVSAEF